MKFSRDKGIIWRKEKSQVNLLISGISITQKGHIATFEFLYNQEIKTANIMKEIFTDLVTTIRWIEDTF